MKILYFDCFSGISGDMTIGALLDLGIDYEKFRQELSKLNLPGYELHIGKKLARGISGTDVDVMLTPEEVDVTGDGSLSHAHNVTENRPLSHAHEHEHSHDHGHDHGHDHAHSHSERNLADIMILIDASSLSQRVKDFSRKVFTEIASAEARVHGKPIDEVHFHEVGAVDSIVDIAGTAICLDLLGVDRVYSSPLHDGSGFIECRHGIIPVPVPAVVEMLAGSGIPLISEDVGTELVTPTGMGIIKCLADSFGGIPPMKIEKTGYGLGKRDTGRLNALRVFLGETYEEAASMDNHKETIGEQREGKSSQDRADRPQTEDEIIVLETNIDDVSPEVIGYTSEKLFEKGALDVFYTPIYMKKNRPAYMLTVLARPEDEETLAGVILTETTTLGVRKSRWTRYCMDRRTVTVNTPYGDARLKIASMRSFQKAAPEYEDCRKLASAAGIPISRIYETVMENARKQHGL